MRSGTQHLIILEKLHQLANVQDSKQEHKSLLQEIEARGLSTYGFLAEPGITCYFDVNLLDFDVILY